MEDDRLGEDLKRPLAPDGRVMVQNLAKWMKDNDVVPTVIYFSPATRTRQTAQILAKSSGAKLIEDPTIQWGNSIRGAVRRVAGDPKKKRIMLVSHHDCIRTGLRALNFIDGGRVDPMAKAELREFKVDRDAATGKKPGTVWKENLDHRILPSTIDDTVDDQYL